jgi:hypothetical protein
MGLVALQSLRRRSIRRIRLPVPTSSSLFPTARWSSFGAGPRPLSSTGCSSLELYLLFRDMLPSTRSSSEDSEHLLGFLPPSRHQWWSPLGGELPSLAYVPPPAFRTLSTACSSAHLAGLFHPAATSGIRASGVFPAAKPARLIDESCPRVVCRKSPPDELPHRCQILPPRLQGLDPGSDPLRPTGGLDLPITRSPPSLSTPAGSSPATSATPSRPLRS